MLEGLMVDAWDNEDWQLIIDYLQGKPITIRCACGCGSRWIGTINSIKEINDSQAECGLLWDVLDGGVCPFLRYHVKDHKREYYCEIEHIKPIVCAAYRCDIEPQDSEQNPKLIEDDNKLKQLLREKRRKTLNDNGNENHEQRPTTSL
jgi:hypothetical protein